MGLLILDSPRRASRELESRMTGAWNVKQLFTNRPMGRGQESESAGPSGVLEVGDFRIDTVHRSATLRGEELGLTTEEFEVLVFLTTHPQRFVTARTMLATNWTSERLHQTEFLKALLGLRKKIDAVSSGKQYLRTEPWVVYRFDPTSSLAT